jgi:hypothetical protein
MATSIPHDAGKACACFHIHDFGQELAMIVLMMYLSFPG